MVVCLSSRGFLLLFWIEYYIISLLEGVLYYEVRIVNCNTDIQ